MPILIKGTGTVPPETQAKTVTPGRTQQVIIPDSGKLLSSVTVAGENNLVAANIKKGISLFGVNGTANLDDTVAGIRKYVWNLYVYIPSKQIYNYTSQYAAIVITQEHIRNNIYVSGSVGQVYDGVWDENRGFVLSLRQPPLQFSMESCKGAFLHYTNGIGSYSLNGNDFIESTGKVVQVSSYGDPVQCKYGSINTIGRPGTVYTVTSTTVPHAKGAFITQLTSMANNTWTTTAGKINLGGTDYWIEYQGLKTY